MSFTPRPYQQEAIDAAVQFLRTSKGQNGLMQLPTGSGKSIVIAGICKELAAPTLVFQPSKEILAQNASKYRMYGGYCGIYSASAGEKRMSDVTFATIGSVVRKKHLLERFRYVIVDECFPAGTMVGGKRIEDIREGDEVASFNHGIGRVEMRKVLRLFKNELKGELVRVTTTNGVDFICTAGHPVYTVESGYVPACELENESLYFKHGKTAAEKELHQLRKGLQQNNEVEARSVLLEGVFGPMEGEAPSGLDNHMRGLQERSRIEGLCQDECDQNRKAILQQGVFQEGSVFSEPPTKSSSKEKVIRENEGQKPHVDAWREGEDDRIEQRAHIPVQRRKWRAHEAPANDALGHGSAHGVCDRDCASEGSIPLTSSPLQGGPCGPGCEAGDRSGRADPQAPQVAILGQAQDGNLERVRVASVEVYQRGCGAEHEEVCPGNVVYNFEVEGNNNYFANGILVHNCHAVNAEAGMYEEVLSHMGVPVVGMTATPYRLGRVFDDRGNTRSILKFLTRTRPRIFDKVIYHVQNKELFDAGYLAKLRYYEVKAVNRALLRTNSTGADYTDQSVRQAYKDSGFHLKLAQVVNRLFHPEVGRKNCLVFTRFTEEARWLVQQVPGSAIVTAETPANERDRIINAFRTGRIRCVANVGILTTGFDYPELEAVVMARPTMSLSLWYQVVGRGVRPHPDKADCMVVDMCGNLPMFGKVEDLELSAEGGWHIRSNGRQLTNVPFGAAYSIQRP